MLKKMRTNNSVDLLKRLGLFLLFMQLTRLLFYTFNHSIFQKFTFGDFVGGLWFDTVTFFLLGLPFIVFQSLPFKFREHKIYRYFLNTVFYLFLLVCVAFNLVDVEYYKHSHKRSTVDLFSIVSAGSDFKQQLGSFFRDFWFLFFVFLVFVVILVFMHRKTFQKTTFTNYRQESILFLVLVSSAVIIGRGGFGVRPVSPLDASYFTAANKSGLVLNTPFTIVKSFGKQFLEVPNFYEEKQLRAIYNPVQQSRPQHLYSNQKNVVLILLESFGAEFVGCAGAETSFTPFLDSLAGESLNFRYGIANGKRSIEAIPAIYLSIPAWMNEAYITSPYANNQVRSLAEILAKNNYETAFFHGATNGSMRFNSFSKQIGIQHYFGRKEYNNDAHFDGTWGILDEYFLPWSLQKMDAFEKPFFSTIFTLSSHHPYFIPKAWQGKLKKGEHPLAETINYADESLRLFFQEAQKYDWYENTLFIFMADHTPAPVQPKYATSQEIFHIPILFFDPTQQLKPEQSDIYFQQIDLYPTLLDLLNIQTKYYAFGNSYFQKKNEAMSYSEGTYYYFFDDYLYLFQNKQGRSLVNLKSKPENYTDSLPYLESKTTTVNAQIKAKIQTFNRDIVANKTLE